MQKPDDKNSSEKENRKVNPEKSNEDYEVREDKNNSIYKENSGNLPDADEKYKIQSEFSDNKNDPKNEA